MIFIGFFLKKRGTNVGFEGVIVCETFYGFGSAGGSGEGKQTRGGNYHANKSLFRRRIVILRHQSGK